jgi:hypothetical protein
MDVFGNKEGHFVIRNVVGKEALSVYWFDTKAMSMTRVAHSDRTVSDWTGAIQWKFHGDPVVFMGNQTEPPLDSVNGFCDSGQYLSTGLSGRCVECAPGFIMPPNASFTEKHANTACAVCALGTHQNATGGTACDSCVAGFFSNKAGSWSCAPCSGGTFQANAGATWCTACARGFFSKSEGSVVCTSCDDIGDYFQELPAQMRCQHCAANTMRYVGDGSGWERTACKCKQNYYTTRNESGDECTACPEGATCGGKLSPTIAERGWWGTDGSTLFVSCPTDQVNGRCP